MHGRRPATLTLGACLPPPSSSSTGGPQPGHQLHGLRNHALSLAGTHGSADAHGAGGVDSCDLPRGGWGKADCLKPASRLLAPDLSLERVQATTLTLLLPPPSPLPPQVAMSLACGSAAGLVSSTATFPLDLVRRRLQLHGQGGSSAAAAAAGGSGSGVVPAATFRSVLSGVVQVRACLLLATAVLLLQVLMHAAAASAACGECWEGPSTAC